MIIPKNIIPVITIAALSVCIAGSSLPKISAKIGIATNRNPMRVPQAWFSAIIVTNCRFLIFAELAFIVECEL